MTAKEWMQEIKNIRPGNARLMEEFNAVLIRRGGERSAQVGTLEIAEYSLETVETEDLRTAIEDHLSGSVRA